MKHLYRTFTFVALIAAAAVLAEPVPMPKGSFGSSVSSAFPPSNSTAFVPAGTARYGDIYPLSFYNGSPGYWVRKSSSGASGCIFYNEDGTLVDRAFKSSCDALSDDSSSSIASTGYAPPHYPSPAAAPAYPTMSMPQPQPLYTGPAPTPAYGTLDMPQPQASALPAPMYGTMSMPRPPSTAAFGGFSTPNVSAASVIPSPYPPVPMYGSPASPAFAALAVPSSTTRWMGSAPAGVPVEEPKNIRTA
ncbi:hypothetical protein H9P43_002477 [Blastocladiella emersonii ATCC 22665]|nr:hypothetical protein H9P43_002477 [Blastocladiella emersonii ATCC 22665]